MEQGEQLLTYDTGQFSCEIDGERGSLPRVDVVVSTHAVYSRAMGQRLRTTVVRVPWADCVHVQVWPGRPAVEVVTRLGSDYAWFLDHPKQQLAEVVEETVAKTLKRVNLSEPEGREGGEDTQ